MTSPSLLWGFAHMNNWDQPTIHRVCTYVFLNVPKTRGGYEFEGMCASDIKRFAIH